MNTTYKETFDNDNMIKLPLLLRPNEAAQVLAISPRKLWELTNCGEIPCLRIGRAVRYSVEDLQQWIEGKSCKHGTEKRA